MTVPKVVGEQVQAAFEIVIPVAEGIVSYFPFVGMILEGI